jgi:hypothetical protein
MGECNLITTVLEKTVELYLKLHVMFAECLICWILIYKVFTHIHIDGLRIHKYTYSRRKLWFYSRGTFFEPRLGHRLLGLKFSLFFSVPPDKCQDSTLKKATTAFIHINSNPLFTIQSFNAMEPELLTPSFKSYKRIRYSDWVRAGRPRGRSSGHVKVKNFLFSMSSRSAMVSIQWISGAFSPGVKRQGREADHSPPSSAEVKKICICTSTPPYNFVA